MYHMQFGVKKKTNTKATKCTLSFKDHIRVESHKRGKWFYQSFVCWKLPRDLLPLLHPLRILTPSHGTGAESSEWTAHVTVPVPSSSGLRKKNTQKIPTCTRRLVDFSPLNTSPCTKFNVTDEVDIANWAFTKPCVIHKHRARCAGCTLHTTGCNPR